MATEVEALIVRMEANLRGYERALARGQQATNQAMARIEARTRDATQSIERMTASANFGGIAAGARAAAAAIVPLTGALAGAFSVQGFAQAADAFTRTTNALKVAGLEGTELTRVYGELFDIAQKQAAPVEDLSRLYGQLSQAQGDLKVSSSDILTIVSATGAALRVSGTSSAQGSGAILGLSQALSGGTVRAEEFNQMLEGGLRPALQQVANNITEAGGSVGKLRELVTEGEVSSRLFFAALQQGSGALDDLASKAGVTTEQALNRLWNETQRLAGELDKATGASRAFAGGMNALASALGRVRESIPALARGLQEIIRLGGMAANLLPNIGAVAGGSTYTQRTQTGIADLRQQAAEIEQQLASGRSRSRDPAMFDNLNANRINELQNLRNRIRESERMLAVNTELDRESARAVGLSGLPAPANAGPAKPPISVSDPRFQADSTDKGGGGGGAAERLSNYEREIEALNRRTAALKLEADTYGLSAEAISRARIEAELMQALQKDGVTITDRHRAEIAKLADAYTETEEKLKSMKDQQQQMNQLQQFIGSNLSSFFSDVISGGKNAEKAVMNLVKRLADAALQAALLGQGPLAGFFGTANPAGGNAVGGLIGALFGGFRATGGPVSAGRSYVVGERGPELFQPMSTGRIIPNRALAAPGGAAPVVNVINNGPGQASATTNPDGSVDVLIEMVDAGMARRAASGRSALAPAVGGRSPAALRG